MVIKEEISFFSIALLITGLQGASFVIALLAVVLPSLFVYPYDAKSTKIRVTIIVLSLITFATSTLLHFGLKRVNQNLYLR